MRPTRPCSILAIVGLWWLAGALQAAPVSTAAGPAARSTAVSGKASTVAALGVDRRLPTPPVITGRGEPKPLALAVDTPANEDLDPAHDEYPTLPTDDITFAPPLRGEGPEGDYDAIDSGAGLPGGTGYQTYTVRKGDTLGSISRRFFGSTKYWKRIADTNGIGDPRGLRVGRVLRIPTVPGNYRRPLALPANTSADAAPPPSLPSVALPPVVSSSRGANETVLYQDTGLPRIILPDSAPKLDASKYFVTLNGLTGLINTFAAYTMGDGMFSTAFGVVWNKITRRDGHRLRAGEDGDYWQFPIALTYAAPSFEAALVLPFESYDIFAPITYNFRDGTDSGMGDAALRLKFCTDNESMASALGIGAIFPTSDRRIGNDESDNAWEVFGAISSKRKTGGNFHVNGGYQASSGNTDHEGVFFNVGFEYSANSQFNFMGEINSYNRVNQGRSTDLTLGMRYYPRPGMALSLAAPIALSNDMFFGYDYRLLGQLQYRY